MKDYYDAIVDFHKQFQMKGTNNEEMEVAFWKKHEKIMNRKKKDIGGKNFRVSEFS